MNPVGLFAQQMAALDKHQGRCQQNVTVEHVHAPSGQQAIVGSVERGGERPAQASLLARPRPPSRLRRHPKGLRAEDDRVRVESAQHWADARQPTLRCTGTSCQAPEVAARDAT